MPDSGNVNILQVIILYTAACPALRCLTIANYSLSHKLHFSLHICYHYQLLNQATYILAEVMTCLSINLDICIYNIWSHTFITTGFYGCLAG